MLKQLTHNKYVVETLKQVLQGEWVNKGRVMDGFGLAVSGDDINVVSNDTSLRGGPDYVHLWFPVSIPSDVLLRCIVEGGHSTLVKIMMDLQVKDRTTSQENVLHARVSRFALRVIATQHEWLRMNAPGSTSQ